MAQTLSFGPFELRPAERQLLVGGAPAALGARAFDVLIALLERRDRVVSKNELLDLVWAGRVVEENNLTVQISTLRRVLGPQAITTIIGRGYRFTLDVDSAPGVPPKAATRPAAAADRLQRRLSTMAAAEVVGWAQRVAQDDTATINAWRELRRGVIEPRTPLFGGRIIELAADGLLAEFGSAVDALIWALDLQQHLQQQQAASLTMRIAVNADDVVVDEDRLLGDGVHATTRMLTRAPPGEVVVGDVVRVLAMGKASLCFTPLTQPAPAQGGKGTAAQSPPLWCVRREADAAGGATPRPLQQAGQQATLAVLPFGGEADESERYFGDGMTEEIITSLSQNRTLLVIARTSTLCYRGTTLSPAEIAAELRVRYLLSGSARRHGGRLRISAELVDAPGNRVIWAERYEGAEAELFDFQARIATSIATAIDPRVLEAELERVVSTAPEHLGAYDSLLRGLAVLNTYRGNDFMLAGEMLRRAIQLDPAYARAHAHLAWWHNLRVGEGRSAELSEDARMAISLSLRAIELDPRDAYALAVAGHVHSFMRRQFDAALELFERAMLLDRNCVPVWALSAITLAYLGRGEDALERLRFASRLSPLDPQIYIFHSACGIAALVLGRDDEAIAWCAKSRRLNAGFRANTRTLIAALALSGERQEAAALAAEFMQHEPDFRLQAFAQWYPLREPHLTRLVHGLRLGGLPD